MLAGVPMMNGASTLEGYVPEVDATVAIRILDAGGTIVGKAVCECFCLSGGSHTNATGPVHNPRKHGYSAGGSSCNLRRRRHGRSWGREQAQCRRRVPHASPRAGPGASASMDRAPFRRPGCTLDDRHSGCLSLTGESRVQMWAHTAIVGLWQAPWECRPQFIEGARFGAEDPETERRTGADRRPAAAGWRD